MAISKAPIRTPCSAARLMPNAAVLAVVASLTATACTMNETQQRVGSGAAIGAAAGGILGGSKGAVIGAAAGAGGGYVVDQRAKRSEAESETERLRRENERLRREQQLQQ